MQAGALPPRSTLARAKKGGVGLPGSLRRPGERRTGVTARPVGEEFGLTRVRGRK